MATFFQLLDDNDPQPVALVNSPLTRSLRNRLLTAEQLDDLPQPEWLIENILPRGAFIVLYGRPGSGKTFVALDMALSIVTGELVWNHLTMRGSVLYLIAEGARGMARRKNAWQGNHSKTNLDGIFFLPEPVNLTTQASYVLAQLADELEADLVIIDTLSRSMAGADENSAKDMSTVVEAVDAIRGKGQRSVIVVHHPVKDGRWARGHGALEGAADTIIDVSKKGSIVTIGCEKQKDDVEFDDIHAQLLPLGDSCVLVVGDAADRPETGIDARRRIIEVMEAEADRTRLWTGPELLDASRSARSSFYSHLNALVNEGSVRLLGPRGASRYQLTKS